MYRNAVVVTCVMPNGEERPVRVTRGTKDNPSKLNAQRSMRVNGKPVVVSGDVVHKYGKYRFIPKGVNAYVCY